MFWKRYCDFCKSIGKSPNAVASELKIASGTVTNWKNGTIPSSSALLKIADYFGCTVGFLIGEEPYPIPHLASINEWKVIFDQMPVNDLLVILEQLSQALKEKQHAQAE